MSIAFVFPGQGSQSVGMQADFAGACPEVATAYEEAGEALGYDLWGLVQGGPAARLDETVVTQPAMLTAGVGAWRAWRSAGGASPALVAGHSLGEYTALVCAGSIGFADAVRLVQRRAELMQAAVPTGSGAMAAIIGLDDEAVAAACEEAADGDIVSPVNFNSPGQVVIAGAKAAVERAIESATSAGARRAMLLSVSVPSHCALMEPAAAELRAALADVEIAAPEIPVVSNVDVATYEDAEQIRDGLRRQLHNPVRWVETVRHMAAAGVDTIVECGPGKVLTGLSRRIDKSIRGISLDSAEAMADAMADLAGEAATPA